MFWKPLTGILAVLTTFFCVTAFSAPSASNPCSLKGQAKIVESDELMDMIGSGWIKVVDEKGTELTFLYFDREVSFVSGHVKTKSEPGSASEQCFLKILKESFAKTYDPVLDENPRAGET